jgi:hypothetical protein
VHHILPAICPQLQISWVISRDEFPQLERLFGLVSWVSGQFNPDPGSEYGRGSQLSNAEAMAPAALSFRIIVGHV